MALGASRREVFRIVGIRGLTLATVGVAFGASGAIGLTRFMKSLLFQVDPADPTTLFAVCSLLIGVTMFACYLPARRATRIEPTEALRYE
jgi:putative ABC transport system permease protein